MTRTISESKQSRACPPMSSEQLNICNLCFSVNALPKGRCLTEHCVVCVPCRGLCVSPGGRSGLCNHNMYTYILVRIYIYTHICVARRTVLFLLQFAYYLGLMVCLYDIVLAHMIICIWYTNTLCKETFVALSFMLVISFAPIYVIILSKSGVRNIFGKTHVHSFWKHACRLR